MLKERTDESMNNHKLKQINFHGRIGDDRVVCEQIDLIVCLYFCEVRKPVKPKKRRGNRATR